MSSKNAKVAPPKDRDSLDSILTDFAMEYANDDSKLTSEECLAQAKAAIRHLSTKELLDIIGPDEPDTEFGCNHNYLRAKLRAALTREENHE